MTDAWFLPDTKGGELGERTLPVSMKRRISSGGDRSEAVKAAKVMFVISSDASAVPLLHRI